MEKLVELPSISKLSDRVVRVLGQNPGKFTLQGTNTYLVGTSNPRILIDTGEGKAAYIPLLEEALSSGGADNGQLVSDIVITHKHADHHGGLPSVLESLQRIWSRTHAHEAFPRPRVHKFPLPSGVVDPTLSKMLSSIPSPTAFDELHEDQVLSSSGATLRVVHTPGHTQDSVCLHLVEEDALFTADSVLGQGTAVFEDLAAYISSLQRVVSLFPTAATVYPGHGPVVEEGRPHIEQYVKHRLEREQQIVTVLKSRSGAWTTGDIVSVIYKDYPQSLWPAAERGVNLHLSKLELDGKVRKEESEGQLQWVVC